MECLLVILRRFETKGVTIIPEPVSRAMASPEDAGYSWIWPVRLRRYHTMAMIAATNTKAATAPMTAIATLPICDGFDGPFDDFGGGVVVVELNCMFRTGILHNCR
jgi:hypothetical protein